MLRAITAAPCRRHARGLDGAAVRVVALEVRGIDDDLIDHAQWPSSRIDQSWPGSRRRRVSQPSPMLTPRPGRQVADAAGRNASRSMIGATAVFHGTEVHHVARDPLVPVRIAPCP